MQNSSGTLRTSVRHPWPVRLWHWSTAAAVLLSLATGFLIFNIHPRLYWGEDGHAGMSALISLNAHDSDSKTPRFEWVVANHHWDVTRWMGVIDNEGSDQYVLIVAPPADFHFGGTRVWHFLSAWVLLATWVAYALYLAVGGRFARAWWPTRADTSVRNWAFELRQHLLLRRASREAAQRYNILQKVSYVLLFTVVFPGLILSGLTMSNSVTAAFPDLFVLFGGRQSARSIHFLFALMTFGFLLIHVFEVFVAGFGRTMRPMMTGRETHGGEPAL